MPGHAKAFLRAGIEFRRQNGIWSFSLLDCWAAVAYLSIMFSASALSGKRVPIRVS
jgi:hypothetical protein